MNQPGPQGSEPKLSRSEAEAMVKLMEQELAIKRARLAAEKDKASNSTARWALLLLILFLVMASLLYLFYRLAEAKQHLPPKPTPPPAAPAKR